MKNTAAGSSLFAFAIVCLMAAPLETLALPPAGTVVVAGRTGSAKARYPIGPIHEGRFDTRDLKRGDAVGEQSQVLTGRDGHLCLVISPGALAQVAPNTQIHVARLQHTAPGLPQREEDLVRFVALDINGGGIYLDGGVPTPTLNITVRTPVGAVEAHGGVVSLVYLGENEGWSVLCDKNEVTLTPAAGEPLVLKPGAAAVLRRNGAEEDAALTHVPRHRFEFCRGFFRDLEAFRHIALGFDLGAVARYLGVEASSIFLDSQGLVADVSPSFRSTVASRSDQRIPPPSGGPDSRRWSEERIWAWWREIGVVRGVNYVPRTCVNSVEMWMKETFDEKTMDEELGWARGAGYTSVRVPLQERVYLEDPDGFLDRLDRFLEIAARHGLRVVPVLFDDLNRAGEEPNIGPQPDPVPGVHNGRWVPSPGPTKVTQFASWPELERYVRGVLRRFKNDRRVLFWDLYNTAGNDGLWDRTLPLLEKTFDWARDVNPSQPLAVPAWRELGSPMSVRKLERSDLITFHSFENAEILKAQILTLRRFNRPIVLSDWLMRQRQSRFETILPVCSAFGVGWFNRGLVKGRTQTWIQDQPFRSPDEPEVWQHDVLKPDGSPYDEQEVERIRAFRYTES